MSLIIKGMGMPQAGDMIICGQIDGKLQCTIVTRGKPTKWCEASEVSTPHGRLIDADYINGLGLIDWQKSIVKAEISQAPTVIEAEE